MKRVIMLVVLMLASVVTLSAQKLEDVPFNGLILDGSGRTIITPMAIITTATLTMLPLKWKAVIAWS